MKMNIKYILMFVVLAASVSNMKADNLRRRVNRLEKLGQALVKSEQNSWKRIKELEKQLVEYERQTAHYRRALER